MPTLQIPIISGPDDGTFWGRLNALSNSQSQVSVGHFSGADGGSRTRTGLTQQILSLSCLPFHHVRKDVSYTGDTVQLIRYPTQQMENGNTWTLVEVLNDQGEVVYSEDFITNYKPTGSRIVTDEQGRILMSDGRYVTPESLMTEQSERLESVGRSGKLEPMPEPVREEFAVDVDAEIDALIDDWLHRVREDGSTKAAEITTGRLRGSRVDARAVASLRAQPEPWVRSLRSSVVERAVPVDGRRKP